MIIKSITLTNFRQYRGTQTIAFSTDPQKNVTVVLGVNTSGKTTLVQAFLWCLYETTSFPTKKILNAELENGLMPNTSIAAGVKIVLVHDDREFTIDRTQKFFVDDNRSIHADRAVLSVSYKDETGNSIPVSVNDRVDTVNRILPQDLSDYFFFDGERIEEINDKKNVAAAVRGLMGLDIVSDAVEHLNPMKSTSAIGRLKKELDIGKERRGTELRAEQAKQEDQIKTNQTRLDTTIAQIEYYEREKKRLGDRLLETKAVREKQNERERLEKDLRFLEEEIKRARDRLIQDFNRHSLSFFAHPLVQKAKRVLKDAKTDTRGIPNMDSGAIEYILQRGRCICGCELTKNQGAVENILKEKELIPPYNIGTTIRTFLTECDGILRRGEETNEMIQSDWTAYCRQTRRYNEISDSLRRISDEIMKLGEVNATQIEQDYRSAEQQLREERERKGRIESNIANTKSTLANIEREISGLVLQNEKNALIRREIAYATAVYEWFKETYDQQVKEVKDNLTASINRIFDQMYHGRRKVEIDDNYRIKLLTDVGETSIKTDESKGLEAVKNFSFISGIVDLARKRARQKQDTTNESAQLIDTEPYPIVMDAPFSNVDEIHIANISMILPDIAEQVILIVMKKDWEHARETMKDRVGIGYMIDKVNNSDTNSRIRRIDDV